MAKNPIALTMRDGTRVLVDSEIDVVQREKSSFVVALGWNYRFKSGEIWRLIPLENVVAWEFKDKPEGR
jgi:hypothetical protein